MKGEWLRLRMTWDETNRRLAIRRVAGSRLPRSERHVQVRLAGETNMHSLVFDGVFAQLRL
jgi:hypothetical protein